MRVLVVEDEKILADALSQILKKNNYNVDTVYDGESGYDYALCDVYEVIILDIMLPKMNGLDILKNIRESGIKTPVLLLTAKSEISDKIKGLDTGADDYLTKPFDTGEMLARVRALSRRNIQITVNDNKIEFGNLYLDTNSMFLYGEKNSVNLTKKEFDLLEYLMINKSIYISKDKIIEKLWGFDSELESNNVEVYISFLRKKLAFVSENITITTVRNLGYKLTDAGKGE